MSSIKLPQLAWYGAKELELSLPDDWPVKFYDFAGGDQPAMKPEEIRQAIANPISTLPLRELARGKKEVAIIFDDMTRVTRTYDMVPFVLDELAEAGIPSRPYFTPIHLQPFYRDRFGFQPGDFPVTEWLAEVSLALPFSGVMTEDQVDYVCHWLRKSVYRTAKVTAAQAP